jgi:hypothetical protein
MTYTCECGDTYTEEIPATGNHNYVSTVTTPATCGAPGVMTYTCSVCGDTYTKEIPATGEHDFQGGDCQHPMICTVCGAEGPMGEHDFHVVVVSAVTHEETRWFEGNLNGQYTCGWITVEVIDVPAHEQTECQICGYVLPDT